MFPLIVGSLAYNLSVRLSMFAGPFVCFFAFFVHTSSLKVSLALSSVASVFSVYQLILASMSPTPPLQDSTVGIILVVS